MLHFRAALACNQISPPGISLPTSSKGAKGGKAELDFLCEFAGQICPLEVKAGINPKCTNQDAAPIILKAED
jgi:hypothetical protein